MIELVQILLPTMLVESGKNPLPLSDKDLTDSLFGQNSYLSS